MSKKRLNIISKFYVSLEDKQTLKEHFRDIVHSLDATGDQSKVSL